MRSSSERRLDDRRKVTSPTRTIPSRTGSKPSGRGGSWPDLTRVVNQRLAQQRGVDMATLLYCGTNPVGPDATKSLLAGVFRAVWAPPMYRHTSPEAGDRVWLLWRNRLEDTPLLLGGGIVESTPEGRVNWTNRTARGIAAAARSCGYGGPSNMAFLRLLRVRIPESDTLVSGLGPIPIGLSAASPAQEVLLGGTRAYHDPEATATASS